MKRFLYCEIIDGGMSSFEHGVEGPTSLLGWGHKDCEAQDKALLNWLRTAKVGECEEHRLGLCIRLRSTNDAEAKSVPQKGVDQ